jgi:hypothetical protein
MEEKQAQIENQFSKGEESSVRIRKKSLMTPEELERFLDNYFQKQQSDNTDRKKR